MVVGSMVGAGVFSLPRNFALPTGVFGTLIAWVIAGAGMLKQVASFSAAYADQNERTTTHSPRPLRRLVVHVGV